MSFKSFVEINGVQTHVACWGRWIEESPPDEVIICIIGNPGVAGYYYPYLEKLHHLTNIPVWTLGHAGHEEPDASNSSFLKNVGSIKGRESLFNLQGQFNHKVEFIKKYTTKSTKIHLLGHSVGAWISMEMLKNEQIKDRIVSEQLLFPTLQKIASTPNGFWLNKVLRRITPLLLLFIWFLDTFVPSLLLKCIIKVYFYARGIPTRFEDVTMKYLVGSVLKKILFMAYDEMDKIKDLDIATLTANKNKIKIIYNKDDKWAPGNFFYDFPRLLPDLYIKQVTYAHAFVLSDYDDVAKLSAELLSTHIAIK